MSATVCNVVEVVLRTPGESINATTKIRRIVFTFSGDLNVNLRAINRSGKKYRGQDFRGVRHYQQPDQQRVQTVLFDRCSKCQKQIARKVSDCLQHPRHFAYAWSLRFRRL